MSLDHGRHAVTTVTEGTTGYCKATFHLNGWIVAIGGAATLYSMSAANQESPQNIGFMKEVHMPEKHGEVVIQTAGDGDHAFVDWTYGKSHYSISCCHSVSEAFFMAGSIAETISSS